MTVKRRTCPPVGKPHIFYQLARQIWMVRVATPGTGWAQSVICDSEEHARNVAFRHRQQYLRAVAMHK